MGEVNVERFTGRFAEELALSADKPGAILRTVESIIDKYEALRRAEADGDVTTTVYLDALDLAIRKAGLTKKQGAVLQLMLEGYSGRTIALKLNIEPGGVSRLRTRIIQAIANEFVKAPERIWKGDGL